MTWPAQETQKAIYNLLVNDSALTALIGANKIFDHVPDNQAYPFVTMRTKPSSDRGNHDFEGWTQGLQIDVWHQYGGLGDLKVQQIQKRIDELIHSQDICIEGWNIIVLRRSTVDISDDPDGRTKHGVQIFKLLLGEA